VAEAANPTLLAETGGFLLGNAHRCGVAVERAGSAIHDFIVAAARDSSEAAAADSRFAEIFLASALPNQDPDAFPSCTVVIERFDRLDWVARHTMHRFCPVIDVSRWFSSKSG
jgi:hypothetical protein